MICRIKIEFTDEGMKALNYERYHHPPPQVQRKMEAIWLKSQKTKHKDICRLAGISRNILRSYLRKYKACGIEGLKEMDFRKPQSELKKHTTTIEAYFREHPPASVKEVMAEIEEMTGIKRDG